MGKPELFSYLSAFVTIVLAVAMTDMIQSTHRLIRARRAIVWDARPLVFAALVALVVVSEFFSLWSKFDLESVSLGRLLWLLATPTVYALLAYSVLPDEYPETGLDLGEFFLRERRVWIGLVLIAIVFDLVRTTESLDVHQSTLWPYFIWIALTVALELVGLAILFFARGRASSWIGLAILSAAVLNGIWGWAIKVK